MISLFRLRGMSPIPQEKRLAGEVGTGVGDRATTWGTKKKRLRRMKRM
jgi:hypothetical protein